MKKWWFTVVPLLLVMAGAPLLAQQRNIQVTIYASQVDMEDNAFDGEAFQMEAEEGRALGAGANWFVTRHLSAEGAVFGIRSDAGLLFEDAAAIDLGSIDLNTVSLGVQFHVLGQSRFDPYIGAGGAYVMADELNSRDLDTLGLGSIELDDEVTYYLNAGLGFQITPGFGLVVDGRMIPYEPTSRSTATGVEQDLELSPRILSVGLRLRF